MKTLNYNVTVDHPLDHQICPIYWYFNEISTNNKFKTTCIVPSDTRKESVNIILNDRKQAIEKSVYSVKFYRYSYREKN